MSFSSGTTSMPWPETDSPNGCSLTGSISSYSDVTTWGYFLIDMSCKTTKIMPISSDADTSASSFNRWISSPFFSGILLPLPICSQNSKQCYRSERTTWCLKTRYWFMPLEKLLGHAVTQRAIRLTILPLRKVPFVDISINSTTIAPLTSSTVLCISQWKPLSRPSVIYKSLSGCLPILNVMLLILIDCCCRVSRVMEFNLAHSTCFCGIWSD